MSFLSNLFGRNKVEKKTTPSLGNDPNFFKSIRVLLASQDTVKTPYQQSIWAYASIKTIAQNIARVPLKLYEKDENDEKHPLRRREIKSGELYDVLTKPNPLMTGRALLEATGIFLELYGEAFWILDRTSPTEVPKEIWVFEPTRFKEIIEDGKLVGWKYKNGSQEIDFDLHEILFFRYFNPHNDVRGMSPTTPAQLSIDQDYFAGEHNKTFFKEGVTVSGILTFKNELTDEAFNRVIRQIEDRHKGYSKAHKILIVEGETDFKPLTVSQKDLDFVNLKKVMREEIFSAYRTNPVVLGFYDDTQSYEGIRAAHRAFWIETLVPKMKYIEDILNHQFIAKIGNGRYVVEFDFNSIEALREDFYRKVDTAYRLWQMGYPINMINKRLDLGMEEVVWGDVWWVDMNKVPVDSAEQTTNTEEDSKQFVGLISYMVEYEGRIQSKLSRYIFEQRKAVLKAINEGQNYKKMMNGIFQPNGYKNLKDMIFPIYADCYVSGATSMYEHLRLAIGDTSPSKALHERAELIAKSIDGIMQKLVLKTIQESKSDLIDEIKKVFNLLHSKISIIAKKEATGILNLARYEVIKNVGITHYKWLCFDEYHRDKHGKVFTINNKYTVRFPCDLKDTSVECKCIIVPLVKGGI